MAEAEPAQAVVRFGVGQVVGDVGEPGAAWLQFLDEGEGLVDRLVHRVRSVAQGVDNEIVEISEERGGSLRQGAEVSEIGGAAKAKAEDFEVAVLERDGHKLDAHQFERGVHDMQINAGDAALRGCAVKNVGKGAAQYAEGFFRAVDRERRFLADVERANVVEPEDVVGVVVGEEDGVEAIEADAEGLLAKVGRGVDDDVLAVARKEEGGAEAVIVRILRGADTAVAGERGDAHGSAGAEDGDFYGSGRHLQI